MGLALRTGKPRNEIKHSQKPMFEVLYEDAPRLEFRENLIWLVYEALPENGAFVVIENIIDDDRRENAFGLLMSLHMLIEFGDAFAFTGADFWG